MPFNYIDMYEPELKVAIQAAHKAAEIISGYQKDNRAQHFELKGRHDLVTAADVASEASIKKIISEAFPRDLFLAEESHDGASLTDERTWIVDPIDGTTNFAHGVPFYAVSIALYVNKEPVVAVVLGLPWNECFTAIKGGGAFLNGQRINVSNTDDPASSIHGTGFPYRDLSVLDDYMKVFRVLMHETHGVRRPGSASYDLAYVACGRYDGFFEYALSPWDVAAGALLIREAGGIVTDWEGGEGWLTGLRIIAGNSHMHAYLKQVMHDHISPELRKSKIL